MANPFGGIGTGDDVEKQLYPYFIGGVGEGSSVSDLKDMPLGIAICKTPAKVGTSSTPRGAAITVYPRKTQHVRMSLCNAGHG